MEDLRFHYDMQNYEKAIKIANQLLANGDTKELEVYLIKTACYQGLFQDDLALESINETITLFPGEIAPKIEKSRLCISIGQFLEARDILENVRAIDPDNLDAIENLIFVEGELHNFVQLEKLCTYVINNLEDNYLIRLSRGVAYEKQGKNEEALEDHYKALEYCEDEDEMAYQEVYSSLGSLLLHMKRVEDAIIHFEKAIKFDKAEPNQYASLGYAYSLTGNNLRGLELINYSLQLESNNCFAYLLRAEVYMRLKKYKKAKKDIRTAEELDHYADFDKDIIEVQNKLKRSAPF